MVLLYWRLWTLTIRELLRSEHNLEAFRMSVLISESTVNVAECDMIELRRNIFLKKIPAQPGKHGYLCNVLGFWQDKI